MSGYEEIPEEPIRAALEVMARFDRALRSKCGDVGAYAVARRLEEFPQLVLQAGLIPALTFYLSKLSGESRDIYTQAITAITRPHSVEEVEKQKLCNELGGEGGGYPHALAILMSYIARISGCEQKHVEIVGTEFIECMKMVLEKGAIVEALTVTYSYEVKKIAKALYPREKE